jgi:hypothetical protein
MYVQLEEFSSNAFGAQQAIVTGHGFDQRDRLCSDFLMPRSSLRLLPPVPAERLAVPVEEGLGLHNEEHLFPVPDGPRQQKQEESIGPGTLWTFEPLDEG